MPTFYRPGKRRGSSGYVVRGWIDGRQHEVRTSARDKTSAQDAWDEYKRAFRKERSAVQTFGDAVRMYRETHSTRAQDGAYLDRLEAEIGRLALTEITEGAIHGAAVRLYPRAKASTRNRSVIAPAAAVMHTAARSGHCDWVQIKRFKEMEPARPLATPEDGVRLARKARGPLRVLLLTLARQGWRITETLMIERAWHDAEGCRVRRWVSKSQHWRWTPLDAVVNAFWKRMPERHDGYLFPWRTRWDVYRELAKLGADYTPHMSRRGFATALIEGGADLKSVMTVGGWEDIKSVATYADVNLDQARRTLGRIRARTGVTSRRALN